MTRFFGVAIIAAACAVTSAGEADAQDVRGDVAAGYSALSSSTGGLPLGWFVSAGGNVTENLGVAAEVSGNYRSVASDITGVTTSRHEHSVLAGPRLVLAGSDKQSVFAHLLVGTAISSLTPRFGAKDALASVTLSLPRGAVYGLVGANGAGKTTLIKHIMGLLKAENGSVRVFGLDPVADPVGVLSRIGYLSEENDLPGWMRVDELIRYSRAFRPTWDDDYAEELRQSFALDPAAKIKNLSKGQKARVGILIALAYRPDLLVLDEPSSGLDPIVRRDILGAIIRTIAHEGRTVLFSSHLLEEVEQVADHVTMINRGKIVLSAPLEDIRESHRVDGRVPSLDEIFVARLGMSPAASED